MPIETYRLEVRESESGDGIAADVYSDDGLVESSARVPYEDYDLEPSDGNPEPVVREVTADVTTIDVQFERDDAGFLFRVLGDRDELVAERVDDVEWGIE